MKRIGALTLIVIAGLVTGCGGGGSSSPSPFQGNWDDTTEVGNLTIASNGHFTGSFPDTSGGIDSYVGTISNGGSISGTATNSDLPGTTLTVSGTATLTGANTLSVTITATFNHNTNSGSGTFTRQ